MGTVSANFLPNASGLDLGSVGQKWDAFIRNATIDLWTSGTTNPALTGTIRLASTDSIAWRNNANGADISLSKTGAASGNIPADTFVFGSVVQAPAFLSATANPASVGAVRLAKTDAIEFRNNSNGADVIALSLSGSDQVVVGGAAVQMPGTLNISGDVAGKSFSATTGLHQSPDDGTPANLISGGTLGTLGTTTKVSGGVAAPGTNGGAVQITAANGTGANGGTVTITGGNSTTSATGGDISLVPGTGASSQGKVFLNGSTVVSNKITSYNSVTTGGNGIPIVVAAVTTTAQNAAIGTTVLYTTPNAGLYRLNYSLTVDTAGNVVNLTGTFGWTDAAAHTLTTANIACNTLGANSTSALGLGSIVFRAFSGQNVTYATGLSGAIGSGFYTITAILEYLG
jgi:hypothetical protein